MASGEANGGAAPGAQNALKLGTITYPGAGGNASGTFTVPPWAAAIMVIGGNVNAAWDLVVQGAISGLRYYSSNFYRITSICAPFIAALDTSVTVFSTPADAGSGSFQVIALSSMVAPPYLSSDFSVHPPHRIIACLPHLATPDTVINFLQGVNAGAGTDVSTVVATADVNNNIMVDNLSLEVFPTAAAATSISLFFVDNGAGVELSRLVSLYSIPGQVLTVTAPVHLAIKAPNRLVYRRVNSAALAAVISGSAVARQVTP